MNSIQSPYNIPVASRDTEAKDDPPKEYDSKEAVLDAAQRLINQYGYAGFSMRDLAQHSGLAKATLYHHFEDKREIFFQVVQRDLIFVRDILAAAAAEPGDFQTRLGRVATCFFKVANERGVLLLSTLRQAAGMEEEFCLMMRNYRDELHKPLVELIREAIAAGNIRPIDPDLATISFFGILQVFTTRHLLMNDLELDDAAVQFIVDFMLNGLAATSNSQPSDDSTPTGLATNPATSTPT